MHQEDETHIFEYSDEYCLLQAEVVKKYLPLLQTLAKAGVLSVFVRSAGATIDEVCAVESVCENGGFQLNVTDFVGKTAPMHSAGRLIELLK